jgi:microcystin degradation protein MlrC
MRAFTAALGSETNTFSPILCGRDAFEGNFYAGPGQHPDHPTLYSGPLMALRRRARTEGWEVVEGLFTFATTGGIVTRRVYEEYRDAILAQLAAALPVDIVALGLHGAMVADGYEDCEGDLLLRIREIVGPGVKVGAELDLHCNLTPAMVEFTDVLVPYKESPHIDVLERGEELVRILADAAAGRVRPTMSVFDCRMVTSSPTTREPMKGFVRRMQDLEGKDGVLSVSLIHCFGFNDVPDMGYKVLVVTDDRRDEGDALARRLGHEIYRMRREIGMTFLSIDEAIDRKVMPALWRRRRGCWCGRAGPTMRAAARPATRPGSSGRSAPAASGTPASGRCGTRSPSACASPPAKAGSSSSASAPR